MIDDVGVDANEICKQAKVEKLDEIQQRDFAGIQIALYRKRRAA